MHVLFSFEGTGLRAVRYGRQVGERLARRSLGEVGFFDKREGSREALAGCRKGSRGPVAQLVRAHA